MSHVSNVPAADSAAAIAHYSASLRVRNRLFRRPWRIRGRSARLDFVLLDVRSPALFARGHVPGA